MKSEDIEARAMRFLAEPRSCTELGEHLWGTRHRMPQAYARPAGALIARLVRKRKVVHLAEASQAHKRRLYIVAVDVASEP